MREIMYVGRKPQKVDNKNNNPGRIWRGLGQVIGNIPDLEAQKLDQHPDIWLDVTKLGKKDREDIIAGLQAQYRAEERRARAGQAITLDNATDDELEAALKKRKTTRGKAVENKIDPTLIPAMPVPGSTAAAKEDRARPNNTDDLGAEVFGAIADLDSEQDFDGEGKPYLERITEKLGYSITQAELDAVWAAFNSKA